MAEVQKYVLGLDAGNTVIKAVLFDLSGNQIAMHALDGQTSTPKPGHVERDLSELWRNAGEAIRLCIQKAGVQADEVAGIGCAGHGNGLYLLDTKGEPLLGIQSLDTRAADLAGELSRNGNGARLHEICLQSPWPSQTPTLLAWVKRNDPALYARIGTVVMCKDFVTYKLTGKRVSDISDMSGAGFVRMPECTYDDELLRLYGLEDARDMLPPLLGPSEIVGHVTPEASKATGLAEGTPVVAGFFDVVACALGSGVVNAGQASIIVGTWSVNQVISTSPVIAPEVFMVTGYGPERFLNIESSATSAANLEWYVRELVERGGHHDDPFGYCNTLVAGTKPSADDPIYHPYLYGSRLGADMRAGFYGIAGWHDEGHMLRALFEGVMFEHRRHIETLTASGVAFEEVVLSGGGARSPVWPQMFADCLDKRITIAACQETGALGAAIAAGVGAGVLDSPEDGVARMTSAARSYEPDAAMKDHYEKRYRMYLSLNRHLDAFWKEMRDA